VLKKAVIAVLVGATCGAAVAYWSRPVDTPNPLPAVVATTSPIAAPVRPSDPAPAARAPSPPQPSQRPQQPRRVESAAPAVEDASDPIQRARLLAQRPDVNGLVALREQMVRRAEEAGERESPATKARLDEIDRYLTEARVLRLKLDAAEFRTGGAEGIRRRD
jgi:hypothetical protein